VEPAGAEIWLDGQPVGRGQYETVLERDGVAHELRASASGHVPARVLFVDTPPPRELRLDPLPEPPVAPHSAAAVDSRPPASPAASEPSRGRKRPLLRAPVKREAPRPPQRARAASEAPRVQLIEGQEPVIRVLD
jgi:hypothetical protein